MSMGTRAVPTWFKYAPNPVAVGLPEGCEDACQWNESQYQDAYYGGCHWDPYQTELTTPGASSSQTQLSPSASISSFPFMVPPELYQCEAYPPYATPTTFDSVQEGVYPPIDGHPPQALATATPMDPRQMRIQSYVPNIFPGIQPNPATFYQGPAVVSSRYYPAPSRPGTVSPAHTPTVPSNAPTAVYSSASPESSPSYEDQRHWQTTTHGYTDGGSHEDHFPRRFQPSAPRWNALGDFQPHHPLALSHGHDGDAFSRTYCAPTQNQSPVQFTTDSITPNMGPTTPEYPAYEAPSHHPNSEWAIAHAGHEDWTSASSSSTSNASPQSSGPWNTNLPAYAEWESTAPVPVAMSEGRWYPQVPPPESHSLQGPWTDDVAVSPRPRANENERRDTGAGTQSRREGKGKKRAREHESSQPQQVIISGLPNGGVPLELGIVGALRRELGYKCTHSRPLELPEDEGDTDSESLEDSQPAKRQRGSEEEGECKKCKICGRDNVKGMARHLLTHKRPQWSCDICHGQPFKHEDSYRRHLKKSKTHKRNEMEMEYLRSMAEPEPDEDDEDGGGCEEDKGEGGSGG